MYFFILLLVWIDLLTKYFSKIYLVNKFNIFWDFLFLKFSKNFWIAFSFPLEWLFLKIITLFIVWGIIFYYHKYEENKNKLLVKLAFIFIIAWGIWNWIERIFIWYVTDFIGVKWFSIFNLADAFLTIWGFLYVLEHLKNFKYKKK